MDHPHIAKEFDGGSTPSGRPYFVMELVRGVPITQFCDDNRLPPRDRLRLFTDVCAAVQHAHQKGIIHRDLKPANVLVVSHDGTPVAKVIDFGVAKAVGSQLTEKTIYTRFNQLIGTPMYMSPEQAGMSGLDVDTRTDIYALGVLLYELLTGTTPFDKERLHTAAYDEMCRIIREEEPPRPSKRLSTLLGAKLTEVSAQRQTDPKRLCRLCRGELDWIVMKGLEKDRNRRYQTANGFARDIQRYLADEPVEACPPSAGYRLRKFARKHWRGLATAAAAAAGLLGLLVVGGVGWLAVRGQAEARRADADAAAGVALGRAEQLASQAEELDPRTPAEAAAAVAVWEQAAAAAETAPPAAACSGDVARRVAERAAAVRQGLDRARHDAALLQGLADVRTTPDEHVSGVLDHANKVRVWRSALAAAGLPARLAGAEDVDAAVAAIQAERPGVRVALRSVIDQLLLANPAAGLHADFEFGAWLEAADRCDDSPFRREVRRTAMQATMAYWATKGRPITRLAPPRADPPIGLPELVRLAGRAEAEDPPVDAVVMLSRAISFSTMTPDADARLRRLLQVARDRHPNDPDLLYAFGYTLLSFWNATRNPRAFAETLGCFRAWITLRPDDAEAYYALGMLLEHDADPAGAAAAYRAALARNPKHNFARNNLAEAFGSLGDLDGRIAVLREALQLDPSFAMAHSNLGLALAARGDLDGAVAEIQEALRISPKSSFAHNYLARVERMRPLLPRLPGVLAGTDWPASPAETAEFAWLCGELFPKRCAAAARLYDLAFAADPKVASDRAAGHRYNAACCAAQASRGEGADAPADAPGRAELRAKALGWLRAELALWQKQAAAADAAERKKAAAALSGWPSDPDLSGTRPDRTALPAAERAAWDALWADVLATLAEAETPPPPPSGDPAGKPMPDKAAEPPKK
jgi:tetratricopeptide (TPR) repeat protein